MANKQHTPDTFWAKVEKLDNGCWEWQGSMNGAGYGQLGYQGKRTTSHRLSYELANGPIPDGLIVRHTCDNPPCCNPAHLVLGTHQDNANDKKERGRKRGPAGAPSINRKFKTVGERELEQYGACPNGHTLTPGNQRKDKAGSIRCATCFYQQLHSRLEAPLTEQETAAIDLAKASLKAILSVLPDDVSQHKVANALWDTIHAYRY